MGTSLLTLTGRGSQAVTGSITTARPHLTPSRDPIAQTKYKPAAAASATASKAGKKKGGLGKFRIPSKAKEQIALSDSTNTTP